MPRKPTTYDPLTLLPSRPSRAVRKQAEVGMALAEAQKNPGLPARGPRKPPIIPPERKHPLHAKQQPMDGTFSSICVMIGGKRQGAITLVNLVRQIAATNSEAAQFVSAYDAKSRDIHRFMNSDTLEALCVELSLPWPRLVSWAYEAALVSGQQLAAMTAAMHLPDVVNKTVKFAKQKDGHRDRDMLYRATGFLPTPAGGISIVNQVAANAQARNAASGDEAFVPFEQDVIDLDAPSAKEPDVLPEGH